ncbi:MAG TPA: Ltp family lipoprotein [Acidimicrobiia bacterium]
MTNVSPPQMSEKETKPWYKKWWAMTIFVLVAIGALGNLAGGGSEPDVEAAAPTTIVADEVSTTVAPEVPATTVATEPTTTVAPTTTEPAAQFTRSEENAIKSAEQYLDFTAFSRSGLIDQLEYEGFTTSEATMAVDYLGVDWNEQASKSAEQYLDFTAFSRSGLIDQLEYEGFTTEQATYGVDQTGL